MNDRRPRQRLPATIIALGVTSFLTDAAAEMIFPLLPIFMASIGASPTILGLIEGLADAVANLLKLGSGYVSDRSPKKRPLVLFGYGIASLVKPLIALATSPWHVLAVRVTDRIGKGIRSSPRDVLIASAAPEGESGRAFGFHSAMDHAGAVVGPLIATLLLSLGWPLRWVFAAAAVPSLLSVVALFVVREPSVAATSPKGGLRPKLSGRLRGYLLILFVFSLGNSSDAFLLLRAKELGLSTSAIPLLWTVFHVSKLLSAYLGGDWSDRVPRVRLIISGWIIYAFTYLSLGFATAPWQAWALFIVYGLYYGLTEPAEKALVKDLAAVDARGRAFGYYNFVIGISALPAGLLMGWLWQTWSPLVALSFGAVVALASAIALLLWALRGSEASGAVS